MGLAVMLQPKSLLYWTPRVLALATAAFLSLFALDLSGAASSVRETLLALGMHLVPASIVLVLLAIAWRWEAAGGLLFILGGWVTSPASTLPPIQTGSR